MNGAQLGYLIAFLAMFVSSMSNFPFTDAARHWGSVALNHYRLIIALVVLTILCLLIDRTPFITLFAGPSLKQYIYVGSSGILGLVVGDYFGFYAMSILGARVSSIFNTLAPGAALAFGYLLLAEDINYVGVIGIVISVAGMIWFLMSGKTDGSEKQFVLKHGSIRKGVIYGTLAGLCQGAHIAIAKMGLLDTTYKLSPLHATWMRIFVATVVYFAFTISRGRLKKDVIIILRNGRDMIPRVTYATIWGLVLSIVLVMWSITLSKVAVVQTILSLVPVVVVPVSFMLYKEKLTFKTMTAAMVSVAGVFVLIWRDNITLWVHLHL